VPDPLLVLLVDDSPEVIQLLEPVLTQEGMRTIVAETAAEALELAEREQPDVVVLDVGLPDGDGIEVCRQLRAGQDPLILMLTARGDEVDRIIGLSAGADDYVVKPFIPSEVQLRITAMVRRLHALPTRRNAAKQVQVGSLTIDRDSRTVQLEDAQVELTRIEFELLWELAVHRSQVLTKDQLHERVWGPNWFTTSHALDVHVSNLRRKLGDQARDARFVQVVRGVGYRLGPCTR
jgi:DNA-binding response OmpR family regulator